MPPTVWATFGRMRMTTTKMWPIKDSVARVIAYADNPQKTAAALRTTPIKASSREKSRPNNAMPSGLLSMEEANGSNFKNGLRPKFSYETHKKRAEL